MKTLNERALEMHAFHHGKLETTPKVDVDTKEALSLAYSPGVAEPCRRIAEDKELSYDYTLRANTVAVVSDGSAVLGLGNIGPEAALPVMEGKAVLFKSFAGVDAFPICLDTHNVDEIVRTVELLAPTFGAVNLEDIKAPECFEIEARLKQSLPIPVFHDDQHGTAIVVLAGLVNALRLVDKTMPELRVVMNGAGAAGIAIARLLKRFGVEDLVICDTKGAIYEGRVEGMNPFKDQIAKATNRKQHEGTLADVLQGADVFIGVSAAGAVTEEMVRSMAVDPVIFALANPIPEIMPDLATKAGARVVATGRSDFANQVNNVLAFPGIFRGALDVRATEINEEMKEAAVHAIADLLTEEDLINGVVIPSPFDERIAPAVAVAVAKAAVETGVAKRPLDEAAIRQHVSQKHL
ncbi:MULTISPECIES: NADP-dependent malic enzyme [Exiguobacterium]|uniref:NAD(P)-dependent malic enzyme n=1 Tax=Exiguobacterium TaxID=33986 RepID=UPI00110DD76A|nr:MULTISPECIES: malic enzyme-like NAD(P)-binding protein [Exiguobacterium]